MGEDQLQLDKLAITRRLLTEIRDAMHQMVANGVTVRTFSRHLMPLLDRINRAIDG